MEVQVGDVAAQADQFGLLHLFWIASPVVKIVMIGLVVASIICWAIVFEKFMAVRKMTRPSTSSSRCSGRGSRWKTST
jgi:biopolymer transport protein TolQ